MEHVTRPMVRADLEVLPHEMDASDTAIQRAAPWISSLLMHAGLALVGGFILFATLSRAPTKEEISTPIMVTEGKNPDEQSPLDRVNREGDLTRKDPLASMQNMFKESKNGADPFGSLDSVQKTVSGLTQSDASDAALIALGTGGRLGRGQGTGTGDGPGQRAAFGLRTQVGSPSHVFGPQSGKRIVYLLDHSGSMLDSFDYLRQEVKLATEGLIPVQRFSVIMVSEDVTVLGPEQLQRATAESKRDVVNRLASIRAQGQNDGLLIPFQQGFEKAFAMKPDVIMFLTDGEFDPRLVEVVKKLNQGGGRQGVKARVNTIAYVHIGVEAAAGLKSIAADSGGSYKFVSEKDLNH